jgi:uncharacterized protein YndB with AHSA1/START domain
MANQPISVSTTVDVPRSETWHYYTEAEHVINWNFASEDWHCPAARNDLREGGTFAITMASKDGNMEVELEGTYEEIKPEQHIAYTLENGNKVTVDFKDQDDGTRVDIRFEPDPDEDHDSQRDQWEGILGNFRQYAERMHTS